MPEGEERISLNDARLTHITNANEDWDGAAQCLREDWAQLKPLIEYYESGWREDVEKHPDAMYGVLSEDGVWNEMGRFYGNVKAIAAAAEQILREYEGGEKA